VLGALDVERAAIFDRARAAARRAIGLEERDRDSGARELDGRRESRIAGADHGDAIRHRSCLLARGARLML
jgi:hypothetical protein